MKKTLKMSYVKSEAFRGKRLTKPHKQIIKTVTLYGWWLIYEDIKLKFIGDMSHQHNLSIHMVEFSRLTRKAILS